MTPTTLTFPAPPELLTREQTAAIIKVAKATLSDWAATGKHRAELPYIRLGKRCYYRAADVNSFAERLFAASATT